MHIAKLKRMNIGSHFRASALRAGPGELGQFLGVDHAWMGAPTFPPHQHQAMSAVSYLFLDSEAGVDNKDSLGTHNVIRPGGLHWTLAGSGIVHEEVPASSGKTVHSLQIFVDLPPALRAAPPRALSLEPEDIPSVVLPGARVRVPLGHFHDAVSPLDAPNRVTVLDVSLDPGATVHLPVDAGESAFALVIYGEVAFDGTSFAATGSDAPVWPVSDRPGDIGVTAGQDRAKIVFFRGAATM